MSQKKSPLADDLKNEALSFSKYLYGSEYRDNALLRDNTALPFYAKLARKALIYYSRDHYNPETISIPQEIFIRVVIKEFVTYKISNRIKYYDWQFIDHFLRRIIETDYNLEPTYDETILKRGHRSEYKALFLNTADRAV